MKLCLLTLRSHRQCIGACTLSMTLLSGRRPADALVQGTGAETGKHDASIASIVACACFAQQTQHSLG